MFKKLINIFKSVQSGEGIDSLMESADKLTDKFTSKLDKMFEDAAPSSDKKKPLGQKYSSATSSRSKDDEDRIAQLEARIRQMEQSAKNENSVKDVKSDSLTIKKEIEWNYWRDLESYFHLPKLEFRFRFWYCDKEEKKKRNLENIEHIESGDLRYCLAKGFITAPHPMALFSDGKIRYITKVGDTLREVKAFATLIGYPIPDKAKTAILAAEIVREKGCDGVCIYSNQILYPSGRVCKVGAEVNFDKLVDEALEESNWFRIPERPSFNGLTPEQCLEKYTEFRNAIVPNPQLSTDEVLKQYNEAVDTWKKKNPDAAWT